MSLMRFQSSGQTNADRRYDYATGLAEQGDFAAAAELYAQTLELAPTWAACWFAYGNMLEKLNQTEEACAAFAKVITLMPEDPFGANMHLYKLGKTNAVNPAAYVTGLFDQYAPRFDAHLVKTLHYRGPEILCSALEQAGGFARTFTRFIDLGCGTGLMSKALKGQYESACGVDLSPQMIQEARKSGLYTELQTGDLLDFMAMQPAESADLILAADVFVYCGDLAAIFAQARRVLKRDGYFGFSVQLPDAAADHTGFVLGDDYRFAHSKAYIYGLSQSSGFSHRISIEQSVRKDRGMDVPGLVVVLGVGL